MDTEDNSASKIYTAASTDTETNTICDTGSDSDADTDSDSDTDTDSDTDSDSDTDTDSDTDSDSDTGSDFGTDTIAVPDKEATDSNRCQAHPSILSLTVGEDLSGEVAEGHDAELVFRGCHLADVEAITIADDLVCDMTSKPLDEELHCHLQVPHGASQLATAGVDAYLRPVDIVLTVNGESLSIGTSFLSITAITASPYGSDEEGRGTPSSPYRTATHAIELAIPGDTVVLQEGRYSDGERFPFAIPPGIALRGQGSVSIVSTCPEDDMIERSSGGQSDMPTRVENITFLGGFNGWTLLGGAVYMTDVYLKGAGHFGLHIRSTTNLHLERFNVAGFGLPPGERMWGAEIYAVENATIWGNNVSINERTTHGFGILAEGASRLEFHNTTIANRVPTDGETGELITAGILLRYNAELTLADSTVTNCNGGILAFEGTSFRADHTSISKNLGTGIWAENNTSSQGILELSNVIIDSNGYHGIDLWRKQFSMTDTQISFNGCAGLRIRSYSQEDIDDTPATPVSARISDSTFIGNLWWGLEIDDSGTALELDNVRFSNNLGAFISPADTEGQLDLSPIFEGTIVAANTLFTYNDEDPFYTPDAGIVEGPDNGLRDSFSNMYYYWVSNSSAAIEFR
jgi:hypothetical protein